MKRKYKAPEISDFVDADNIVFGLTVCYTGSTPDAVQCGPGNGPLGNGYCYTGTSGTAAEYCSTGGPGPVTPTCLGGGGPLSCASGGVP